MAISLTVRAIDKEDIYRDRIRVPVVHRAGIGEGRVCKLSVPAHQKHVLVEARGIRLTVGDKQEEVILMDEITRSNLGSLHIGQVYQFEMKEVSWAGQFIWAWNASDPTARIAARLGVLGLALGVIGVLLGVLALLR